MVGNRGRSWFSRNVLAIVVLPALAAVVLAGVSVFRGWLHQRAGFDPDGKPLGYTATKTVEPIRAKPRATIAASGIDRPILEDIRRRDRETRPRLRYLTLVHRWNDPTCTEAKLDAERLAVRELLGVLQTSRNEAVSIDPERLVFRLDLADCGWDAAIDWHKLASAYRYALKPFDGTPEAATSVAIREETGDEIPVVRADWFVAAQARRPVAGLPDSVRELAKRYANQTLDLAACARELGLTDAAGLRKVIDEEEVLRQEFGLAPLLRGESIRRDWWEGDRNLVSPYQELARRLKVGRPIRVQ